jgi:hypothetical protein
MVVNNKLNSRNVYFIQFKTFPYSNLLKLYKKNCKILSYVRVTLDRVLGWRLDYLQVVTTRNCNSQVALGQVCSENFGFPCQSTFHLLLHNHLQYICLSHGCFLVTALHATKYTNYIVFEKRADSTLVDL